MSSDVNYLDEKWRGFERRVLDPNQVGVELRRVIKDAFYAGVLATLETIHEQDTQIIPTLDEEFNTYSDLRVAERKGPRFI